VPVCRRFWTWCWILSAEIFRVPGQITTRYFLYHICFCSIFAFYNLHKIHYNLIFAMDYISNPISMCEFNDLGCKWLVSTIGPPSHNHNWVIKEINIVSEKVYTWRSQLKENWDKLVGCNSANFEMNFKAMTKCIWKYTWKLKLCKLTDKWKAAIVANYRLQLGKLCDPLVGRNWVNYEWHFDAVFKPV